MAIVEYVSERIQGGNTMNCTREPHRARDPMDSDNSKTSIRIETRVEQPGDENLIYQVNAKAFGQIEEAELVNALREHCSEWLSLVAVVGDKIVGHILFSPVSVHGDQGIGWGMGLAPMAVLPEWQRRGIGSRLVRDAVARLREAQCPFLVVLGHPEYYPRFGFKSASFYGIECEWAVPDEAFMIKVLDPKRMKRVRGMARYRPEFGRVGAS